MALPLQESTLFIW